MAEAQASVSFSTRCLAGKSINPSSTYSIQQTHSETPSQDQLGTMNGLTSSRVSRQTVQWPSPCAYLEIQRATLISWFPPAQLSENTLSTSEKFIFVLIFSWLQRLDAHMLCSQVNKFLSGSWELSNEWLVAFHKVIRMESQGEPPDEGRVLDNANTFLGFQVSAGILSGHGACWAEVLSRLLGGHIWPYELLSIR